MTLLGRAVIGLAFGLSLSAASARAQDCGVSLPIPAFGGEPLTIASQKGPIRFKVEVALTEAQQEHGLMCRKSIGRDRGMLYVFSDRRPVAFWMKDTLAPLDLLFIDASGSIFGIVANAKPQSLDPIRSVAAVAAVLEINGGEAEAFHIQVGDRVQSKALPHD